MRPSRTRLRHPLRQVALPLAMVCTTLAGLLIVTAEGVAAPAPRVVGESWTLAFKPGPLRLYTDPLNNQQYWYFTYQVVNSTGGDRMFAPRVELFTDKGEILRSGRGVPTEVNRRIRGLLDDPLLEDGNQILGDLKQGKEHAKDGLVVWPVTDIESNDLTIFLTGLSNATERVPHPVTGEEVVLRKTLRLDYHVPGDPEQRGSDPARPVAPESTERALQMHARVPHALWIWR